MEYAVLDREVPAVVRCKPGKYVIGDPTYLVPKEARDEVSDSCGAFGAAFAGGMDKPIGTYTWKGEKRQVVAFTTLFGDGTYTTSDGVDLDVDAGLIGLVPADEVESLGNIVSAHGVGYQVDFDKPFHVYREGTLLVIGHLDIDLDPVEVEDEWEEDEEEDDGSVPGFEEDSDEEDFDADDGRRG